MKSKMGQSTGYPTASQTSRDSDIGDVNSEKRIRTPSAADASEGAVSEGAVRRTSSTPPRIVWPQACRKDEVIKQLY